MSDTANDYTPGRSLLAEITTLREEMEALRKAMGLLVDLQREIHTKLDAALRAHPIAGDAASVVSSQVV
jgi:hypothetical protein